jgi:chemotaxis methyl-accepting protein methylase
MFSIRHQVNKLRYARLLATADRINSNYSRFTRNRVQLDALVHGPVIGHVRKGNDGKIRIVVLGCSYGPEPVSIASLLLWKRPDVDFVIDGYDIDERSLDFARRAVYERRHVFNRGEAEPNFVEHTFDIDDRGYVVHDEILERIRYHYGDATDEDLRPQVGTADIVFAQHFLYHLTREKQAATFRRIASLLLPDGVLFVDGMDVDLRYREVRRVGLVPLDYKVAEIHKCSRRTRWASSWPHAYYGLEPLERSRDWKTRYATIFTLS